MSYILDALRRAEAQRQQGAVPDVHAQPFALPTAPPMPAEAPRRHSRWLLALAGVGALAGVAAAWWWTARGPEQQAASAAVNVPAPVPAPVAMVTPPPPSVVSAVAQPVPAPVPPTPGVTTPVPSPAPAPAATPTAAPASAPAPAPPRPPTPAPRPAAPAPAPAAAALPVLSSLSPDLRAAVPAMAVGGHVHSPAPASRMLIVNGQVLREGDAVAPEVRLETIGRKSAVFSVRGQRFEMPL